ncbi:MAG TPA: carboxymuconolactone decarboxylase family protein [Devosiaceae bacterium]|jgi:AhpD family alkylhydroperoxidase|nr:carboxymuconolactone decarboxylase family protein [Devosiaceae bacterium]
MTTRINPYAVGGNPVQMLIDYGGAVASLGLEKSLIILVETRASQINGCAGCLVWHTREARATGETEARIYQLDAWRESPLYSRRERAAIAWTEALTRMDRRDMDDAYALVAEQFTPEEQVQLNLAIGVINSFNRLNIGFAVVPPAAAEDRREAA